jgi:hypothetical protein
MRQDGAVFVSNAAVQLTNPDHVARLVSGSLAIQIPNAPGQSISIDVTAGGYRATTLTATIAPPPP